MELNRLMVHVLPLVAALLLVERHVTGEESAAAPVPSGGPNVCNRGTKATCCPGWTRRSGYNGLCIVPICRSTCGDGRCIRPNLCFCNNRQVRPSCEGPGLPGGGLVPGKDSNGIGPGGIGPGGIGPGGIGPGGIGPGGIGPGNVVGPGQPQQPTSLCQEPCLNGGRCIGPDRCACVYGFTGRRCERDYRTGPCFRKVQNQFCAGQLTGVVCTRQLCCATVGVAWGHPCEQCPSKLDCARGFITNIQSRSCQDVDECEAIPGICENGKCINSMGSFRCECDSGYLYNEDVGSCEDVNECEKHSDLCTHGRCINTEGSFNCLCDYGYVPAQNQQACLDTRQENCYIDLINGQCKNPLAVRLSKVECCCGENMGKGWGAQPCQACPLPGSKPYSQLCTAGMLLDINECDLRRDLCENGKCINTPSSYRCECDKGFRSTNNDKKCVDVDECQNATLCQGGRCMNSVGSFNCFCPTGYDLTSDGTKCTDQDECSITGMCANGICVNGAGSFTCRCKPGFSLSPTRQSCIDIDECKENARICLKGRCVNTPGSYKCECQDGFVLSPDGDYCLDRNECEEKGMCRHGTCVNGDGSFKCICDPGYKLSPDGHFCIDINECLETPDACVNGKCDNTDGSFRCTCTDGLTMSPNGRICQDTRRDYCFSNYRNGECSNPSSMVVTKSACCCANRGSMTPAWGIQCVPCPALGSKEFLDLCPKGPGSGQVDDINECIVFPNICPNGACENLKGSYRCICNHGYQVDATGKVCSDINECAVNLLLCDNGQCRNTPGSFQCTCPIGYRHNVLTNTCDDIDECKEKGTEICIGGTCFNTLGSYRCECETGSALDASRNICIDNRRGSCWMTINPNGQCENDIKTPMLKSECCGSIGKAWGSPCQRCSELESRCPKGYAMLDGSTCTDINECEVFPNICQGGGLCVNTDGSYQCNCPPGLTLDHTGTNCFDLREEVCYLQYDKGRCLRPFDGLYKKMLCCCSLGVAWGHVCEPCPRPGTEAFNELCVKGFGYYYDKPGSLTDINECVQFPTICQNGKCRNTAGSFSCQCNQGFATDSDGLNCTDINECSVALGVCANGICRNTPGSFRCDCDEGYEDVQMMQTCDDIDECSRIRGLCRGGSCRNTPGSFRCDCPPGHELTPDGRACKDVDECSRTSGICSHGVCENMMGSYQCTCNDGYKQTFQHTSCEDTDECASNNGGCQSKCINVPGSYRCDCEDGYKLMPDGATCEDIDECKDIPNICSGGKCTNYAGTHTCHCTGGLVPSTDGKSCNDIDECALNSNVCLNGRCENNLGSYACQCELGYSVKDGEVGCTDDNECEMGLSECDEHAECLNTLGSYECSCLDGFRGDGFECRDINECLRDNGGCDPDAACINTMGSFQCICDNGFTGDGFTCRDVDECTMNPTLCENGQCLNYGGSYRCECDMGFEPEEGEKTCVDVDECALFQNNCAFGRCENVFGMFRCICNTGYQLDSTGGNCTDINECDNPQICQYGTCINTPGSFVCECPPNYTLAPNGAGCVDVREGQCFLDVVSAHRGRGICNTELGERLTKATCCCSVGKGWGPTCEVCPVENSTDYRNLCPGGKGFRPNQITVVLEDIDECRDLNNVCDGGRCSNTFGSFMCICPDGYTLDSSRRKCIDINECALRPDICGAGTCINSEGSYTCICPPDYVLGPSRTCIDMRRANCFRQAYTSATYPFKLVCEHPMMTNETKVMCCCSIGRAWGDPCEPCPIQNSEEYRKLCSMSPGTYIDPVTGETGDMDECKTGVCENGYCTNTIGSFVCECYNGYRYNSLINKCEDINECIETPGVCEGSATCVNTLGSFECRCPDGYKLSPSKRDCLDVNECSKTGMCDNGVCKNLDGSFRCTCNNGYYLSPDGEHCIDIDECKRSPGICADGTCTNTEGSYKCHCNPGFQLSPNGDCFDIDECRNQYGICQNGRCRNTIGSYTCQCQVGYALSSDGRSCIDTNECSEDNMCTNGVCRNSEGSFVCTCKEGYQLTPNKKYCEDIDECRTVPGICDGGLCKNTVGSFTCVCAKGYRLSLDGKTCVDTRQNLCFQTYDNGACRNPKLFNMTRKECCCMVGSAAWGSDTCEPCPDPRGDAFKKLCPDGHGYVIVDGVMEDINECMMDSTLCENGICINMDGNYRCECQEGFKLDPSGTKCIDMDECRERPSICGNGTCTNVIGGFECDCRDGFTSGPRETCEDIDECDEMASMCAFRCQNLPGTFKCTCPYGYALAADGRHCEDLDECQTPANDCRFACKNLVGSFMCICPDGYRQVGMVDDCIDVDECRTIPGVCANGRCINTRGSYRCECIPGYQPSRNGKECIDVRSGNCYKLPSCPRDSQDVTEMTKVDCCCGMGAAWGPRCEMCPLRGSQTYADLCPHGVGFDKEGRDVDECTLMPHLCHNGRCINTMGSYRCICNKGYKPDHSGTNCIDVNECDHVPPPCKFTCENTEGSFRCSCPEGYILGIDRITCIDVDECKTGRHHCQNQCTNTIGSYKCSCQKGYSQDGGRCRDVNECTDEPNLCSPVGTCMNMPGSFKCICPRGYSLDPSGKFCVDTDECLDDSRCPHGCENLIGSYRCGCPDGYQQHYYWNQCVDENECTAGGTCGSASCENTIGSYSCSCPPGYIFEPSLLVCIETGAGGCQNAPCSFGCSPTGPLGYSCGCPDGYQRLGQGHCLSAIPSLPFGLPGQYGDNLDNNLSLLGNLHVPSEGSYNTPGEKVISTEGCYSCKLNSNNRQRRDVPRTRRHENDIRRQPSPGRLNHHGIRRLDKKIVNRLQHASPLKRVHHPTKVLNSTKSQVWKSGLHTTVFVPLNQLNNGIDVLKIQPALKYLMNNEKFEIVDGNKQNLFKISARRGIAVLHTREKIKQPGLHILKILGTVQNTSLATPVEEPFHLTVHLVVK
ncbi:unnamed protein product [Larinioides sclopetarius]|uniref:Fibrillin-2 n=1 Tax=Larinioides sclopetarius TaxID=280406 RepID=A0AAV1ZQ02_9ARAC